MNILTNVLWFLPTWRSTESGSTRVLCDPEYFEIIGQFIPASLQSEVSSQNSLRFAGFFFLVVFKYMYVNVGKEYMIHILISTHKCTNT